MSVFDVSVYKSAAERDRARVVYGITVFLLVAYGIYGVLVPSGATQQTYLQQLTSAWYLTISIVIFFLMGFVTIVGTRAGHLRWTSWGPAAMWVSGIYVNSLQTGIANAPNGVTIMALIVITGLLKGRQGVWFGTILALAALALGILLRPTVAVYPDYITSVDDLVKYNVSDLAATGLVILGTGVAFLMFLRVTQVERDADVSEAVEERGKTADVVAAIAQAVAARSTLNDLLDTVVQEINATFDLIYHTQIFLVDDDSQDARLVASTGRVGEQLLRRGHHLRVGSGSVIGQVTLHGHPVVARPGERNSVHKRNELLPLTAVETALPLRIGDRIIGALDLQSRDPLAFSDRNQLATFQALADSITLAVDNVSQYEKAQVQIQENEALIVEAQEALREVERLNERLTGRAWSEYLRDSVQEYGLSIDFATNAVRAEAPMTQSLQDAMQHNYLVQTQQDEVQLIAVPLRVRGQVIGAMEFELDADVSFSPDDYDLIQEVSERFGIAADNARLVEESQRNAQREALVNQITARLQSVNNVDNMVTEAAQSLLDSLKAERVAIRLGVPPETNGHG